MIRTWTLLTVEHSSLTACLNADGWKQRQRQHSPLFLSCTYLLIYRPNSTTEGNVFPYTVPSFPVLTAMLYMKSEAAVIFKGGSALKTFQVGKASSCCTRNAWQHWLLTQPLLQEAYSLSDLRVDSMFGINSTRAFRICLIFVKTTWTLFGTENLHTYSPTHVRYMTVSNLLCQKRYRFSSLIYRTEQLVSTRVCTCGWQAVTCER